MLNGDLLVVNIGIFTIIMEGERFRFRAIAHQRDGLCEILLLVVLSVCDEAVVYRSYVITIVCK